jgi:hypothetical protein
MLQRCTNPNNEKFPQYGGRGIRVCERWLSFENFLADMGEPSEGLSLDREDNDGHYEPGNCRWATDKEQARNTRQNHWIEVNGERVCMADAASMAGLSVSALCNRIKRGMTPESAVAVPRNKVRRLLGSIQ